MAVPRSIAQCNHWDPFHLLRDLSMTLCFMVSIKQRCTLTRRCCTKDHCTGSYTYFILSIMQNGNKSLLGLLSMENIGKLLKFLCLSNCVCSTKSGTLSVAVTTPSHIFILITKRNKYVLEDTVRPTATFSVVTEFDVVTSPGWTAKLITWLYEKRMKIFSSASWDQD